MHVFVNYPFVCVHICPSLSTYKTLNKYYLLFFIFPCGTSGKESVCQSPRRGCGNPLQYFCLENSRDRGVWQATVHWVAKGWTVAPCTYAHTFLKSQRKWNDQTPYQLLFWYITLVLFPHSINTTENAKKQQLEPDMEKQTDSKLGKEYTKAVYCHPAYLTYMQSTSCEMPGWMKHKLESRLLGEISITSNTQMTPPLWQKAKKN